MKKYAITMFLAVAALSTVSARQLSPSEALQRVQTDALTPMSVNKNAQAVPVLEIKLPGHQALTALYVFSTGPGYMIVSADDCAAPLLGYSATGTVDLANPELKYWLDFYARQIEWATLNGVTYTGSRVSRATDMEAIAPLLKSTWNQSAPYNDKCPEFNGERSVTGCVATAMAQVMYYHQWPESAQGGTVSYTSEYSSEYETQISLNFDDVTFDWDNMLPSYTSGNYTTAQGDAVAELMYAAGVSVEMEYSPVESAAESVVIPQALYKYFDYSSAVTMPNRGYYTDEQWQQIIYDQLDNNLPVLYCGQSTEGGHQFVCDGYNGDGYFHFNWGWAGQSDGYYLLSALDPESQGIGGSTSGFNFDQMICINVAKPSEVTGPRYLVYCAGDYLTEGLYENMEEGGSSQSVELGDDVIFMSSNGFANFGCASVTGTFGILLTDGSGNTTTVYASSTTLPLASESSLSSYTVALPESLAAGTYSVTPIFLPSEATDYIDVLAPLAGISSLTLTVDGTTGTITVGDAPDFSVTSAEFKSEVYAGSFFSLEFTAKNSGDSQYYGSIAAVLLQDDEEVAVSEQEVAVTLNAGEEGTFNLIAMFETESGEEISPGTYQVVLVESTTGNSVGPDNTLTVEVQSALETQPTLSVTLSLDGDKDAVDPSAVTFKGTVTCESGYLADQLMMFVFPASGGEDIYYTYTDYLFIGEGDAADFTLNVNLSSVVTAGDSYEAAMYTSSEQQLGEPVVFTVATSAIGSVFDEGADTPVDIYDIAGHELMRGVNPGNVHSLNPGLYIVRRGTTAMKVLVK